MWTVENLPSSRTVSFLILAYIGFFLLISPLVPGVSWFALGDFTLPVVNYYHVIMIPLAMLLMVFVVEVFDLASWSRKIVNWAVYPMLLFSILGLAFFNPAWAATADEIFQAIRDVIVFVAAIVVIVAMIWMPFKNHERFKQIWGAYFFVLIAGISAAIAGAVGMMLEYGNLYGFSSIGFFNSYVNSVGGLDTFLGNAWTTHSHQMLPAIMGLIVGLTALIFKYDKASPRVRNIINIGMIVAIFGTLSMTYLYWISLFGTYVIPAIFVSGVGGMNGLALDDSQTGIVGIGAIIVIIGLLLMLRKRDGNKLLSYAMLGTWVGSMFALFGIGYTIEFNETYYGFGAAGTPPNGGAGYLNDMAFTNGHLLYAFFLLVVAAGVLMIIYWYRGNIKLRSPIAGIMIAGIIIGGEGLLIYVMLLQWIVEAIGLCLIVLSIILVPISLATGSSNDETMEKTAS